MALSYSKYIVKLLVINAECACRLYLIRCMIKHGVEVTEINTEIESFETINHPARFFASNLYGI